MTTDFLKYPTGKIPQGNWCDSCGRYNSRYSTSNIIGVKGEKILLTRRNINPEIGKWCIPGGYLQWDETIEEGAEREFLEETGYKVNNLKLFGVYSNKNRDKDGRQNIGNIFICEVKEKIGEPDEEVAEVKWFNLSDLPEDIAFDHRKMIEDYIHSNKTSSN
jgi:ADP-ribose pyrophosphatase YjhB (NUDIX family)